MTVARGLKCLPDGTVDASKNSSSAEDSATLEVSWIVAGCTGAAGFFRTVNNEVRVYWQEVSEDRHPGVQV